MDFSWVKQLADQANQAELARQERDRRDREDKRLVALATVPFVEKLYLLINTCTDEFNKHCMFPNLRVMTSRLYKRQKTSDLPESEPEEVAYFTFSRRGYMYGIRGVNGVVDFVEFPVTDGSGSLTLRLDELGVEPSRKFIAEMEREGRKVTWKMDGCVLDGPMIISVCQHYFSEFIGRTNEQF